MRTSTTGQLVAVAGLCAASWLYGQSLHQGRPVSSQDHVDIQHLYAQYNETIDNGDVEGWVGSWTPDGDFNGFKGQDELRLFARDYITNGDGARRRHWINNLVIHATPEGARATNYFMILDVSVTPPVVASTGRNVDTFMKTRQGWRFKTRTSFRPDGARLEIRRP